MVTLPEQKRVRGNNRSVGSLVDDGCEGRVDFTFGAGVHDINLYSESARSILHVSHLGRGCRKLCINRDVVVQLSAARARGFWRSGLRVSIELEKSTSGLLEGALQRDHVSRPVQTTSSEVGSVVDAEQGILDAYGFSFLAMSRTSSAPRRACCALRCSPCLRVRRTPSGARSSSFRSLLAPSRAAEPLP